MLKYILYLLVAAVVVGLIAGGVHLLRTARKNQKEMAPYAGAKISFDKSLGRVLVVYYSLSGHTKDIAERIKAQTGGEIFAIETTEKLEATPLFYAKIKQQLKSGDYPSLAGEMPDFDKYDMIFVGAPVWWYTIATPVLSFLQQADFKGKPVIPFSTQGSNYGSFFEDFALHAQNAKLGKGASFNNLSPKYNPQVDNKIASWLNSL